MEPMENVNLDLVELIRNGAISTYPLLLCSIIVLGIALERIWSLRGMISSTARLTATVVPLLAKGDLAGARDAIQRHQNCPARRIYADILATNRPEVTTLGHLAEERQFEEAQGAGSYLWVLATIGSAAPFIGLFGTVMGIMRAFHSMAIAGTGGFGVVAGGISEALIATALGLLVGIIAVALYNYFTARVERIDAALRIGSGRVIEALATGRSAHGA
jgi:biopolymer transport protein ExbB